MVHRSGTRNGRAWSRHDVVLNDGTSADDVVIKLWNQRAAPEKDANVRITNLIVGEFNGHKDLSSTDRTAVQVCSTVYFTLHRSNNICNLSHCL